MCALRVLVSFHKNIFICIKSSGVWLAREEKNWPENWPENVNDHRHTHKTNQMGKNNKKTNRNCCARIIIIYFIWAHQISFEFFYVSFSFLSYARVEKSTHKRRFSTLAFKIAHLHSLCVCLLACLVSSFFPLCALHIPITRIHSLKHTHALNVRIADRYTSLSIFPESTLGVCSVGICYYVGCCCWCCFLVVEIELSYRVEVCRVCLFFASSPIFLLCLLFHCTLSIAMCVFCLSVFSFSEFATTLLHYFFFCYQQLCVLCSRRSWCCCY